MNQSLRATGEESVGPSGRMSLLMKEEKRDETVHHSSVYRNTCVILTLKVYAISVYFCDGKYLIWN